MLDEEVIARVHPISKAYRKNSGQYGYSGHVIKIAQEITIFAMSFPWNANSDHVPITVIQPPDEGEWEGRDFFASTYWAQLALVYLIAHNPGYDGRRIDLDRLQSVQGNGSHEVDMMGVSNCFHPRRRRQLRRWQRTR